MEFYANNALTQAIISSFKNLVCLGYDAIDAIDIEESLSVSGRKRLNSLRSCALQMNRICNIVDFLITPDDECDYTFCKNYDPKDLLEETIRSFESVVWGCLDIKTELKIDLPNCLPLILDQTRFEFMFLNILYCCIKQPSQCGAHPIKIIVSATETKDKIIIRIRDNNSNNISKIINSIGGSADFTLFNINDRSFETLVSLSIRTAYKAAEQLEGRVSYTSLKSGNRFEITLPKYPTYAGNLLYSLTPYHPDINVYNQIFADILFELS
jgi:hypothetical protein